MPHVRTVIINAVDRPALASFWSSLLGVEVREANDDAGITWLQPDQPGGVDVGIQQVAHKRGTHTEIHMDIAVDDLDAAEQQAVASGGIVVKRNRLENGFEWRVLADPEGNEFCIFV